MIHKINLVAVWILNWTNPFAKICNRQIGLDLPRDRGENSKNQHLEMLAKWDLGFLCPLFLAGVFGRIFTVLLVWGFFLELEDLRKFEQVFIHQLFLTCSWKLTWHWTILIFNKQYIFIHGGYSIVMLVFLGGKTFSAWNYGWDALEFSFPPPSKNGKNPHIQLGDLDVLLVLSTYR